MCSAQSIESVRYSAMPPAAIAASRLAYVGSRRIDGESVNVSNVSPVRCQIAPFVCQPFDGEPSSAGVNGIACEQPACPSGQSKWTPRATSSGWTV
jgi:hypothetical protein